MTNAMLCGGTGVKCCIMCHRSFKVIKNIINRICFPPVLSSPCVMTESNNGVGFSIVSDYLVNVKVCENCGGGRTFRESHLYFILLRDAPSSPFVLIGSGEQVYAGGADVNRA